jgi:hypothetical protein
MKWNKHDMFSKMSLDEQSKVRSYLEKVDSHLEKIKIQKG